jgi:hypothetical protein
MPTKYSVDNALPLTPDWNTEDGCNLFVTVTGLDGVERDVQIVHVDVTDHTKAWDIDNNEYEGLEIDPDRYHEECGNVWDWRAIRSGVCIPCSYDGFGNMSSDALYGDANLAWKIGPS